MHRNRLHILRPGEIRKGPVVYWMSREQRVRDNWALIHAQETALKQKAPLLVIFCLVADFLKATLRQYHFMLQGLEKTARNLSEKKIPFSCSKEIPMKFCLIF